MSSLWRGEAPLVLASGSATRSRLLEAVSLPFEIIAPNVDERAIEAKLGGTAPADLAVALSRAKALAVSAVRPDAFVVGADQVLSCEGVLFHKARAREDAMRTLKALSGRTHRLISAVALARDGEILAAEMDAADLTMRPLDPDALAVYLDAAGDAVLGSVGAYQWEGLGAHLFARVEGDHTTILGLPMLKLLSALRAQGLLAL